MEIWWKSLDGVGLEHLRLSQVDERIVAESSILRIQEGKSFHLNCKIICDSEWRVREVELNLQSDPSRQIKLSADGQGNWTDASGNDLPEFKGCFEVDISATPFTNTLPIKRSGIKPGESVEILVVYFLVPEMTVQRSFQRYQCLEKDLFRFEEKGVFDGFSAEIKVDENGLVTNYPQLFTRA